MLAQVLIPGGVEFVKHVTSAVDRNQHTQDKPYLILGVEREGGLGFWNPIWGRRQSRAVYVSTELRVAKIV